MWLLGLLMLYLYTGHRDMCLCTSDQDEPSNPLHLDTAVQLENIKMAHESIS